MVKKAIVRFCAISFLTGIGVSSFFVIPLFGFIVGGIISGLFFWRKKYTIACAILFLLLGSWRVQAVIEKEIPLPLAIDSLGRVVYRDYDGDQQKLRLQLATIAGGNLLITVPRFPSYHYGDVLSIRCKPEVAGRKAGPEAERYYRLQGIAATCWQATVGFDHVQKDWRWPFFQFKDYVLFVYRQTLPGPVSGLMQAMIMNERGELASDTASNFSRSGLSHVVAISGMNMTLLVIAGRAILIRCGLRRRQSAALLISLLTIYVIIIGSPASAVRAAVMTSAMLLAQVVRRPFDVTHTLILVAALLAAINPLAVIYDLGWQLSFLALAGLIWWTPWWTKILSWVPEAMSLRELASATLAAQMLTWPLILFQFNIWALWFLPANLLTVPLVGPIMIIGLLLPLIWWLPIIGNVMSYFLALMGQWLLTVVTVVGTAPHAVLTLPFSSTALISCYILMIGLTRLVYEKNY